jgi:acetyltransferase-like isoleucine patch superfamily enzyme
MSERSYQDRAEEFQHAIHSDLYRCGEGWAHRTAVIGKSVRIGKDTVVWQFATILPGAHIGERCSIGSNVEVGRGAVIGNDTRISHGVFIPSGAWIGNRVFVGPSVTMTDDKYPRANNPSYIADPPKIEDDVAIGAGSVLLPGVLLEQGCLIGAGSVVVNRIPKGVTVCGNPATTPRNHTADRQMLAVLRDVLKSLQVVVPDRSSE